MSTRRLFFTSMLIFAIVGINAKAQDSPKGTIEPDEMIALISSNNLDAFDSLAAKLHTERQQSIKELLNIFEDKKSSSYQQCAAAYYLGEMRASEAADFLGTNITLNLNEPVDHLTILMLSPVVEALVKIGNPSIPAVIRNLEQSDDADVRKLSLQVLYRIDGDKDISQLRLQKALSAEKDSQKKQARLQATLKELSEMK